MLAGIVTNTVSNIDRENLRQKNIKTRNIFKSEVQEVVMKLKKKEYTQKKRTVDLDSSYSKFIQEVQEIKKER